MPRNKDFDTQDTPGTKTLTPGALTAKRFFRNRLAVAGLVLLGVMFLFCFLGGALTPYGQDQVFYRLEEQRKQIGALAENETFRFTVFPEQGFGAVLQAQFTLAQSRNQSGFSYGGVDYTLTPEGGDLYTVSVSGVPVCFATRDILELEGQAAEPALAYGLLRAYAREEAVFDQYTLDGGTVLLDGRPVGYISRLVVSSAGGSLPSGLKEAAVEALEAGKTEFSLGDNQYFLSYDAANRQWSVGEKAATRVWDAYAPPSGEHPLGTDKNGMDMLTRLMYGGRVSLVIGFIVVLIAAVLGSVLGGIAGYFGRWVDSLIMRIVDVFYCIPSTPLLIILGAAMDGMRVQPRIRMLALMLVLGFLGWPSIARLVRGQILSLREQEFMTAAEAGGISVSRRIFRHLLPNVIPQLIVACTMSLGSTILTEATLSFLGLGVKFPFASWGNIMNDVANAHVLTSYWFVWIPAGVCLVLSVLGFNFVGDGLRDAFDPKMNR